MYSEHDYKQATEIIHAMDIIARAFNDEYYQEIWLANGVPDGTDTLEDVRETYQNDETFDDDFNDLCETFLRLCVRQCARIKIDTKDVIYCGQDNV